MVKTLIIWWVIHTQKLIQWHVQVWTFIACVVCYHVITIGIVFSANLWVYSRHMKVQSRTVSWLIWGLFFYAMTVLLCYVRIRAYAISASKPTQLHIRNAVWKLKTAYENSFLHKIRRFFCVSATSGWNWKIVYFVYSIVAFKVKFADKCVSFSAQN